MSRTFLLFAAVLFAATSAARAADPDEKLTAQKKAAEANWAMLDAGDPVTAETAHLLIYGPKSTEKRLKDLGAGLEKVHDMAFKSLKVDADKDKWWPGKLTVYVLPERAQFTAFVRRVEKRRLEDDEYGGFQVDSDVPHVAAGAGKATTDPSVEAQAAQQIASAVLQRKAGPKVPLPGWLVDGYGRATFSRTTTGVASADHAAAINAVIKKGRTGKDVWNGSVTGAEVLPMQASVAEYLAYGPGAMQFDKLLSAFRPDEGQEKKETAAAFAAAEIKPDELEKSWWAWAQKQR